MAHCRTRKTTVTKVDEKSVERMFFANEFPLIDASRAYHGLRYVLENDKTSTRLGIGRYEFPLRSPSIPHFLRRLQLCDHKDDMVLNRLVVHKTGMNEPKARMYDYGPAFGTDSLDGGYRVIMNLRDDDDYTVGIGLMINERPVWLETRRAYATIVPTGLTHIMISAGSTIPGTRQHNTDSIFVIMDVTPLRGMAMSVADRLCQLNPVDPAAVARGIRKMAEAEGLPFKDIMDRFNVQLGGEEEQGENQEGRKEQRGEGEGQGDERKKGSEGEVFDASAFVFESD